MIRDFGDTLDDRFKNAETITKLNRGSREIRKVLKRESWRKPKEYRRVGQARSDFIWNVYHFI